MLSLTQLRTFLEVARLGSVRETAAHLVVSQPAVSAALASLQREVGAQLVERDGRGLRLTDAVRLLALYGNRIFALIDEGRRRTREAAALSSERLRLAAVTTAAEHLAPELLGRFREEEPRIEVELEVGNRERLWERLAHWDVDLAIAGRPPHGGPFRTLATRAHELVVVGPLGDPFGRAPLGQATWLLREFGSGTRAASEAFFAQLGIDPPRLTIGSNGAIQACVRAGLGLSLVSRDAVDDDLKGRLLQTIPTPLTPLARHWHLVAAADRELPPAAARFITFITTASFVLQPNAAPRADAALEENL